MLSIIFGNEMKDSLLKSLRTTFYNCIRALALAIINTDILFPPKNSHSSFTHTAELQSVCQFGQPRVLLYFQHTDTVFHLLLTAHLSTNNHMLDSQDKASPVVLIIPNNSCLFYDYFGWTNFHQSLHLLPPTSTTNTSKRCVEKLLSL